MSVFIVVQVISTSLDRHRILKKVGDNLPNGNVEAIKYESVEPALMVARSVKGGTVIRERDFKNYIKTDDLYRLSAEAAKWPSE